MHCVLSRLWFIFHHLRKKRNRKWNLRSIIRHTTSSSDSFHITSRVSNGVARKSTRARSRGIVGFYKLEVELRDLPSHLEYAFLEGDDKFPVIIAKDLSMEEKTALITVLKSHKRAIAWKLSDIKDFDADPRVPLILERSFLKTERALIDVFEGELTLRVGKEAITFNLDRTLRYSDKYNDMKAKRIDVIDMACEEYSQE
nr:reverse transcriptase domain-containing protein [Tanacetum cinerariifolium]